MEDFNFFERWPTWLRWLCFLPMVVVGYSIAYFLGRFALWYGMGWVGVGEKSFLGYIIYGFHQNYISYMIGFAVSVACIPKGKIILQSIYTGLLLFVWGFSSLSFIMYGDPNGTPTWVLIYDGILNVLAAVTVIFMAIQESKELKNNLSEMTSEETI